MVGIRQFPNATGVSDHTAHCRQSTHNPSDISFDARIFLRRKLLGAAELSLLELTAAYAVLANGGMGVFPYGVRAIRERDGEPLYQGTGIKLGRIVKRRHAAAVDDMLRAVVAWGTGTAAKLDAPVAGKTGTSQGNRDAWFIGYTDDLVAGVWMGNDDGSPMDGVTGGGAPARIWRRFMELASAPR